MGQFSDEEKAAILARARATIEQVDAQLAAVDAARNSPAQTWAEPESSSPASMQHFGHVSVPLKSSAPMNRWRAEAAEWERKCEQEREKMASETNEQRTRDWERWADARIDAAIDATLDELTKAIGQVVGEERKYFHAYIDEQIGLLRAELTVQRAHESGKVLDLPAVPLIRKPNGHAA